MAKIKGTVVIDKEQCKGCGLCISICPQHVLIQANEVNQKGYYFSVMKNPELCTGCANCATVCPDMVITVYRLKPQKGTKT